MSLHILVADDHPIVRQGLKLLIEREVSPSWEEASDGREAVRLARALPRHRACSRSQYAPF